MRAARLALALLLAAPLLAAPLLAAPLLAAPGIAYAEGPQEPAGVLGLVLLPGEVTFLVADVVYAAEGRTMPQAWAVGEVAWGTLELAWAATYAAMAASSQWQDPWFDVPYVSALALAGAFHFVHAMIAMVDGVHTAPTNLRVSAAPGALGLHGVF